MKIILMKGKRLPNILLFISYDESGNEEEPSVQPISLIRSSKKRIEPIHDVKKEKKRRMSVSKPADLG